MCKQCQPFFAEILFAGHKLPEEMTLNEVSLGGSQTIKFALHLAKIAEKEENGL